MSYLVSQELVQVCDRVESWQEAVTLGCQPLLEHGYITEDYVQAIFEQTEKLGPYYVIAPNIALPHARPEHGVLKQGIAVLHLLEPIKFKPDGYDVRLVITLAPRDNQGHLNALVALSTMLDDERVVSQLLQSSTKEELYEFFKHI